MLLIIYGIVAVLAFRISGSPRMDIFHLYLTISWSSYLPLAIVGSSGAISSRKISPSTFTGRVEQKVIILVPTIGRLDVVPALVRVVESCLLYGPRNLDNFRIDVVTEEGAKALDVLKAWESKHPELRIVVVPKTYHTANGTLYKARANQYALEERTAAGESRYDVFVYHLDDDTAVGADTIASIAEFISSDTGRYHLAQGVLTFPHELSASRICRLLDSVRPADDLTRFNLFTGILGRPYSGLHGEHLLIRASIEANIGWDFGRTVKVEDAYFGLTFAQRYPGCSKFLNSCTYGASPESLSALVAQRRRWAGGLFELAFSRQFSLNTKAFIAYATLNWSTGIFQHVLIMMLIANRFHTGGTAPVAWWVIFLWSLNLTYQLWTYIEGLRINLQVTSGKRSFAGNIIATILLFIVFSAIEGYAAFRGLVDYLQKKEGFVVIAKGR